MRVRWGLKNGTLISGIIYDNNFSKQHIYDINSCISLIHGWCSYFMYLALVYVSVHGCPELKPSQVSNTGVLFL